MTGFTIERTLPAPRARVWQAWTDPSLAALWWHPKDFTVLEGSVAIDLRAGGRYTYTMVSPDGDQYPTGGEYRRVEEPTLLAFTWGEPMPDGSTAVITVELTEEAAGTRMTFTLEGIDGGPGDNNVHDGWAEAFDILEGHLG